MERPTERYNPLDEFEPGEWLPRLVLILLIAGAAWGVRHFLSRPRVFRYRSYAHAVSRGLASNQILPYYVPASATNIVHATEGGRFPVHYVVVEMPRGMAHQIALQQQFEPITLGQARAYGRVPTAEVTEWPQELRSTDAARPGFTTFYDRLRLSCAAIAPDSVTLYVWTCQP